MRRASSESSDISHLAKRQHQERNEPVVDLVHEYRKISRLIANEAKWSDILSLGWSDIEPVQICRLREIRPRREFQTTIGLYSYRFRLTYYTGEPCSLLPDQVQMLRSYVFPLMLVCSFDVPFAPAPDIPQPATRSWRLHLPPVDEQTSDNRQPQFAVGPQPAIKGCIVKLHDHPKKNTCVFQTRFNVFFCPFPVVRAFDDPRADYLPYYHQRLTRPFHPFRMDELWQSRSTWVSQLPEDLIGLVAQMVGKIPQSPVDFKVIIKASEPPELPRPKYTFVL